jgi:ribonuclease D
MPGNAHVADIGGIEKVHHRLAQNCARGDFHRNLAEQLKRIRNRRATEVGLPKGTLLANAVVLDVARAAPRTIEDLSSIEGMRGWKVEILGSDFLAAIRGG